jgi:hypothetical protein
VDFNLANRGRLLITDKSDKQLVKNERDTPPDLAAFLSLLDAQPAPMWYTFNYCLCRLMVEAGKLRLVETVPGERGEVCTFETVVGDRFSVARPVMSRKRP